MSGLREFGENAAAAVLERVGRGLSRVQEKRPLAYDLLESDDAYLVVFDVPGAERSDVQVRYLDGEVQIQVDRFREFHEGFDTVFPGRGLSLDGAAPLPDDASVDAQSASATLAENGTLRVQVPKRRPDHESEVEVVDEDGPEQVEIDDGADEAHDAEGHDDEAHDAEGHDDETHDAEGHDDEAHDDETHDAEGHDDEAHDDETV